MTLSFASLRRTFAVTALFAVAGGTGLAKETPRLAAASETNGVSTARLQRAKACSSPWSTRASSPAS